MKLPSEIIAGRRMDVPVGTPDTISVILQQCWQHEPQNRPSLSTIAAQLRYAANEAEKYETTALEEDVGEYAALAIGIGGEYICIDNHE